MNQQIRQLSYAASVSLSLFVAGCATESSSPTYTTMTKQETGLDKYVSGYRAYHAGDTEQARTTLERAVADDPQLLMARSILGEIYRKNNQYDAAAKQYEALVKEDPYTLNNHYYLGVSYQFLTRFKEAAVAYLRGLDIDPNDFRSNMNLGTVYLALGDLDSAVKYLDHATQLDPQSAAAWSNLGVALDTRGSLVLAETSYRKAIERDPDSQAVVQNLANNLLAQKKTGEAIYLWEQIVAKNSTSTTNTKLAEAYSQGGDFAKAHAKLDEVLGKDPRFVLAINAKANAYIRQYELSGYSQDDLRTKAVEQLKRSLALNSSQPRIKDELNKWKSASAIK